MPTLTDWQSGLAGSELYKEGWLPSQCRLLDRKWKEGIVVAGLCLKVVVCATRVYIIVAVCSSARPSASLAALYSCPYRHRLSSVASAAGSLKLFDDEIGDLVTRRTVCARGGCVSDAGNAVSGETPVLVGNRKWGS